MLRFLLLVRFSGHKYCDLVVYFLSGTLGDEASFDGFASQEAGDIQDADIGCMGTGQAAMTDTGHKAGTAESECVQCRGAPGGQPFWQEGGGSYGELRAGEEIDPGEAHPGAVSRGGTCLAKV